MQCDPGILNHFWGIKELSREQRDKLIPKSLFSIIPNHSNSYNDFVEKHCANSNESKTGGKDDKMVWVKVCLVPTFCKLFNKVLATHMGSEAYDTFFTERYCEKRLLPAQQVPNVQQSFGNSLPRSRSILSTCICLLGVHIFSQELLVFPCWRNWISHAKE